jgi:hypothetical protein
LRIIPLLNGCVKCIHVDMDDFAGKHLAAILFRFRLDAKMSQQAGTSADSSNDTVTLIRVGQKFPGAHTAIARRHSSIRPSCINCVSRTQSEAALNRAVVTTSNASAMWPAGEDPC